MNAQLRLGDWQALQALAAPLRTAVFVEEQGVPAELEWDADDAVCLHAVLAAGEGPASATGRLLPAFDAGPDAGYARIGRMAVRAGLRGAGLGAQVLDALLAAAARRGDLGVLLHAQCSAEGFYARRGFRPRGEVFDEAGIAHVEMTVTFGEPGGTGPR